MLLNPTHYETLGVAETASAAEVRAAYRALALRYHPDRHAGNPHYEERFKQISAAYRALGDPARRQLYDTRLQAARERQQALLRQRHAQTVSGADAPPGDFWPAGHRYHYATTRPPASVRERAYRPIRQPQPVARLQRRDRRILLVLLIFVTTAAGGIARWTDVRHSARAEEAYLAGVLNAEHGNWARALVDWSEAIHHQPDLGAAYARRAEVYASEQHDYAKALADYDRALRHLPTQAEQVRAHTGRATCLLALGDRVAAEAAFARALALDPTFAPALLARSELRIYQTHQYGEAIADCSALLRATTATSAECTRAVKLRGLAWLRLGDAGRASHDFISALSADESDGQTWYLLACAAQVQGEPARVEHYLAAARRRGYRPPEVLTN